MIALVALVFVPVLIYVLSLWTDRNLEFWFSHFKHAPVVIPQWLSIVVTIVLNGIAVALNVIGELCRYLI